MILLGDPIWKDARERALAYKATLDERILEDLKRTLGFYRTTFDPNPTQSAFNEGQRSVIVAILNTIASADMPVITEETEDYNG